MEIQYKIFKEDKLLVQKYNGDFSIEKYQDYIRTLTNNQSWKDIELVLTDLRNVNLSPVYNNIENLITIRSNTIKKKYLNVFLVDTPRETAILHLYQEGLIKKNYNYAYCSTIEKAIELLNSNTSEKELEEMISNLNSSF